MLPHRTSTTPYASFEAKPTLVTTPVEGGAMLCQAAVDYSHQFPPHAPDFLFRGGRTA